MNNIDIKKILNELYAIDPDLRSREKEIVAILHTLAIKSPAAYDEKFAVELRTRLLTELATSRMTAKPSGIFVAISAKNMRYSLAGLLVLVLVGAIAIFVAVKPKSNGGNISIALLPSSVTITRVGGDAFGPLESSATTTNSADTSASAAQESIPAGQSATAKKGSPLAITAAPMNAMAIPVRPIAPPIYGSQTAKYDYTGAPFTQNQTQLDVLKKVATPLAADRTSAALAQAGFGQIDISTFSNLDISNVTLSQNQSFGYQIYIDLAGGTVSISQNYDEWPKSDTTPLVASAIPSDDAVIAIANQFFTDHHLSISSYGTPTVTKTPYAIPLAASEEGNTATNMPIIPSYFDSKQVLYPLVVNGMNVYNQSGEAIGITIDVNLRYRRVADVYGIEAQNYQASAYDAITNTSTILDMAGSNITTLDLGTPTMAYLETYQTDTNGTSNEFLVPAFVFPVTGSAASPDQKIVVPLIQDFVRKNLPIRPIPLGVSAPGVATSSPAQPPSLK